MRNLYVTANVGINFIGNQAIPADPGIKLTEAWVENGNMFPHALSRERQRMPAAA